MINTFGTASVVLKYFLHVTQALAGPVQYPHTHLTMSQTYLFLKINFKMRLISFSGSVTEWCLTFKVGLEGLSTF